MPYSSNISDDDEKNLNLESSLLSSNERSGAKSDEASSKSNQTILAVTAASFFIFVCAEIVGALVSYYITYFSSKSY
jgi:F0F1-type ATP synthase assembly protein I